MIRRTEKKATTWKCGDRDLLVSQHSMPCRGALVPFAKGSRILESERGPETGSKERKRRMDRSLASNLDCHCRR